MVICKCFNVPRTRTYAGALVYDINATFFFNFFPFF